MEKPYKYKLRKDSFTGARGGSSKFIIISCAPCKTSLLLYQKDGPGNLFRLYLDRISAPAELAKLYKDIKSRSDLPSLRCPQCKTLVAAPMPYKQENRLALRLLRGTYHVSKSDGTFEAKTSG